MSNRTKRTPQKKGKFLKSLSTGIPNVARACRAAAIGRTLAYQWRKDDPDFAEQWENAYQNAIDNLEETAWKRAGREKNPSDTLLIFVLKSNRREIYGDRQQIEHQGKIEVDDAKNRLGELVNGSTPEGIARG